MLAQGAVVYLAASALVALGLLAWGFFSLKRKRLIENVPTSKVKGVFLGLNEVKGRAVSDQPLQSYLAEVPCVYYAYAVEEQWRRTVHYTDSKGRSRTRTESGWKTLDKGETFLDFYLQDSTGALLVRPRGAEIDAKKVFDRRCGRSDPLYYARGPRSAVANSTHRRRFVEHAIPLNARLYVLGPARLSEERVEPEIARDRRGTAELYLISTRSEEQLARGYARGAGLKLFFGTAAAFFFPVGFALEQADSFGAALEQQLPTCLAAAAGYGGAIALYYLTLVYNGLVSVRERAEMAWSMIDVQLRRRHVLIPRLVACVQGYARHEQETQRRLAELRVDGVRGGGVKEKDEEASAQGRALTQLFALAESYPDLEADENFAALQKELVDTEDRIALARNFYNAAVTALNLRIATLPDALVAKLTGFREQEFFAARGFERSPVRVDRS